MRLVIATDAWFPQVNGVVRSLATTIERLEARGISVDLLTPADHLNVPMPGYGSIRMALAPRFGVRRRLAQWQPDAVHIATEGPIGWAARAWCNTQGVPHTSAFHTRFPEYAAVRTGLSPERFWPIMRRFHSTSRAVLVSTQSLAAELAGRGIGPTRLWSRGIDEELFRPEGPRHPRIARLPGPVLLYVGRVAKEKNLEAFLGSGAAGTRVVVGDGPSLASLKQQYPTAVFLGALAGEELASAYRAADCFVFPSRTDTFGLVVIEALACGLPVAAYPVTGPVDILGKDGRGVEKRVGFAAGVVDDDLEAAIAGALVLRREDAAALGAQFSWEAATDQFLAAIATALDCDGAAAPMLAA